LVAPELSGGSGARIEVPLAQAPSWRLRAGIGWRDGAPRRFTAEGSEAAWVLGDSELYASVQRRHWGPGHAGSLIVDGAAEPVPAIGWRRPQPRASGDALLRWLGPWSADVFVGALTEHREPRRPKLIGMRIEAEPWPGWEFGLSRTLQWGGQGRPEGFEALTQALIGNDNGGLNPSNQLAGLDWRVTLSPPQDVRWYGQVIGEDEAGQLPSANVALTGLDWRWGDARLFVEYSNTVAGQISGDPRPGVTYRHGVYRQGYTNDALPLGHPSGGDVELTSAGLRWQRGPWQGTVIAAHGRALRGAQRFAPGPLSVVNAVAQVHVGEGHQLGAGAWWLRSAGGRDGAAQVWWQYAWR
jgi:hypothetical protein